MVPEPSALVLFDTQKILVRPQVEESIALDAQWSDSLPKLLQAKIIQSFENANYPQAVARPTEGLTADYQLLIDIRSFQVMLLPEPSADVEFSAKILAGDGRLVGSRIVHASVPVGPRMRQRRRQASMRPSARPRPNWCFGYQALFEGPGLTRHHQRLGESAPAACPPPAKRRERRGSH